MSKTKISPSRLAQELTSNPQAKVLIDPYRRPLQMIPTSTEHPPSGHHATLHPQAYSGSNNNSFTNYNNNNSSMLYMHNYNTINKPQSHNKKSHTFTQQRNTVLNIGQMRGGTIQPQLNHSMNHQAPT